MFFGTELGWRWDGSSASDRQSRETKGGWPRQRTPGEKAEFTQPWSVFFSSSEAVQVEEHWLTRSIERNGEKLYVPVEQPSITTSQPSKPKQSVQTRDDDAMQLDDSKHKVYIYDLDAELSESDSDDCKLVFLPDIEKHLRQSRIPQSILANSDGELAGDKQVVLYNVPSALTVPEAQDSVRRAVIESRARARANQEQRAQTQTGDNRASNGSTNGSAGSPGYRGMANHGWSTTPTIPQPDDDPDAMDLG